MKAVLLKDVEEIEVVDQDRPTREKGQTLVKVSNVGVCGSDLHCYRGNNPFMTYPRVIGHEASGFVEEPDPDSDLKKGDRVTLDPVLNCGHCYACSIGKSNICDNLKVYGIHTDGFMREYAQVRTDNLHKAEGIDNSLLALAEPLTIGMQANNQGNVGEGQTVSVIGSGTIGLMATFVAKKVKGADKVITVDVLDERLEYAKELGADAVLNSKASDFDERYRELTDGVGSQVVIEAVGKPVTVEQSIELAAPAGRVVILGLSRKPIELTTQMFIGTELEVVGSRLNTNNFPQAVKILEEQGEDLEPLITHRMMLEDIEEALFLMESSPEDVLKIMLEV